MVYAIIGTTALLPIGNELKTPPKKFSDVHIFLTVLPTRSTGSSFHDDCSPTDKTVAFWQQPFCLFLEASGSIEVLLLAIGNKLSMFVTNGVKCCVKE